MKPLRLLSLLLLLLATGSQCFAQVTANFTAITPTMGCSPVSVSFLNQSTGNPTSYQWFFGNGNSSVLVNPGAVYLNPGLYSVTLIATDGITSDTMVKPGFITVFANPVAAFQASVTQGCAPLTVQFTDMTTPANAPIGTWHWQFGTGAPVYAQNPVVTFQNPGTYTVSLIVFDQNGCRNQVTFADYITVTAPVVAAFSDTLTQSCSSPLTVNFTNQSTGPGNLTYQWNFGNGQTSSQTNPNQTYTTPGVFDVTLIAMATNGCSDTLTKPDLVAIQPMVADFSVPITYGCAPFTVQFSDNSSLVGASWYWDFGDGNTSTDQNLSHTYAQPGTYDVLFISSVGGVCTDTVIKPGFITVLPTPFVDFSVSPSVGCQIPQQVQFTDLSGPDIIEWFWNFGNGLTDTIQNPGTFYTAHGSYAVSLTGTGINGCSTTEVKPDAVMLGDPLVEFFADSNWGCIPFTTTFRDMSNSPDPITSWFWDFGDGGTSTQQNPSHTYLTEGMFDITLIIQTLNGCSDTLTKTDFARAGFKPTAGFYASPLVTCLGTAIQFFDTSAGIANSWSWDFGDGGSSNQQNPSHMYSDTGTYTINLVVHQFGCPDTLEISDYITVAPPDARFDVIYNCSNPFEVVFRDSSLAPHTWHWDFGDGNTSTLQHPIHTYAATGDFQVTLTVTDTNYNCVDTRTALVEVRSVQAGFNGDTLLGCAPLSVNFFNTSIDAVAVTWVFPNTVSQSMTASNVFSAPGIYDVTLIAEDIHQCRDTLTLTQYITATGPVALFSGLPTNGCAPLTVSFSDTSQSFMGNIVFRQWDFGDGDSSNAINPVHTYDQSGTYPVSLFVMDNNGCESFLSKPGFIQPTFPTAYFNANRTVACPGANIHFGNFSTGHQISCHWDWGDGTFSTNYYNIHVYQNPGVYTVSLTVTDANGCDTTFVRQDYITIAYPTAGFSADSTFSPCPPHLVNFSSHSSPDVSAWHWDFGDGNTSSLENPANVYLAPGVYTVTLVVTSATGCKDTLIMPDFVTVLGPNGTFSFSPPYGCLDHEVTFEAVTWNTVARTWDFGDGNVVSAGDTVSHTYTAPGIHHPVIVLDDGLGCLFSVGATDSVVVGRVISGFFADTTYLCKRGAVSFTNTTTAFPYTVGRLWNFGDGNTSSVKDPVHVYTTPGIYTVSLITSNGFCQDTFVRTLYIEVDRGPQANFSMSVSSGCVPIQVHFSNLTTSDSTIAAYFWNFGDGSFSTDTHPVKNYNTAGTFQVSLVAVSVTGCTDTFIQNVNVYPLPAANAGPNVNTCIGTPVQLQASGGTTYSWLPQAGLSNPFIANPVANPISSRTYVVQVTSQHGCISYDSVHVNLLPLPTITADPAPAICFGDSVQLQAHGGLSYQWNFAQFLSTSSISNPLAFPDSTTVFSVIGYDQNGCYSTANVSVRVNPLPSVFAGPDTFFCVGANIRLQATGAVTYNWTPATGLSSATISNPFANPGQTTTYTVTGTDGNGCSNSDEVTVTVRSLPVVLLGNNVQICKNDSVQLMATGAVNYLWSPAAGLDNPFAPNPKASPATTTQYFVSATDVWGCQNSAQIEVKVNQLPIAQAVPSFLELCAGMDTSVLATGGANYRWEPNIYIDDTTVSNPIIMPPVSINYRVTVTDTNQCSSSDTLRVVVHNLPQPTGTPDTAICWGDTISLFVTGGSQYFWLDGKAMNDSLSPNPIIFPDENTLFVALVRDSNGCDATFQTDVTVHPLPPANAGFDQDVCFSQSTVFSGSGGLFYQWSPPVGLNDPFSPNPVLMATQTTVFQLEVIDSNGCVNTDQVLIQVQALPVLTTSPNSTICRGESVPLLVSGADFWQWYPPTGLSCTTCPDPIATPVFTTTYYVVGTDIAGCQQLDSITITVNPVPVGLVSQDTAICEGNSVQLLAVGGAHYQWTPFIGMDCYQCPNPVAIPASTTTYVVSVTNDFGCTVTDSLTITVNVPGQVAFSKDTTVCNGVQVELNVNGGVSWEWMPGTGLSCTQCPNPVVTALADMAYQVAVTDGNGCTILSQFNIFVKPYPEVNVLTESQVICEGTTVRLEAEVLGATAFIWEPQQEVDFPGMTTAMTTPSETGWFVLSAQNQWGCAAADSVQITVIEKLNASSQDTLEICFGQQVFLNGITTLEPATGVNYIWIPASLVAEPLSPNTFAFPETSINFMLIVNSEFCESDTAHVYVHVNPIPFLDAGNDLTVVKGSKITLTPTASENLSFSWFAHENLSCQNCSSPVFTANADALLAVTATDENGCSFTDNIRITIIEECGEDIFVPNTFTPNGNGINDKLFLRGQSITELKYFRVYDRWGKLVFETKDLSQGWDGSFKGTPLSSGVYVWHFEAICNGNSTVYKKGNTTLLR